MEEEAFFFKSSFFLISYIQSGNKPGCLQFQTTINTPATSHQLPCSRGRYHSSLCPQPPRGRYHSSLCPPPQGMYHSFSAPSPQEEGAILLSAPSPHDAHVYSVTSVLSDSVTLRLLCSWDSAGKNGLPSSRGPSAPMDGTRISYVSCICRRVLYHERHLWTVLTGPTSAHTVYSPQKRRSHSFWTQTRLCCSSTWNFPVALHYIDMKSSELAMIRLQNPT